MTSRDRLRDLLDAVLDEEHDDLAAMAAGAHASPYHFARTLSGAAGEAPVAMRRRVMLERAAWRLRCGASVTDAAWEAGYESVEGFSRAFARAWGRTPSTPAPDDGAWLPATNGIHFHPPASLWVARSQAAASSNPVLDQLVRHDVDDTGHLLALAAALPHEEVARVRRPGARVLEWSGAEESLLDVLAQQVRSKQVWLAAVRGDGVPAAPGAETVAGLQEVHREVGPAWLAFVRDLDARAAWDDVLVDALCDPPESFVMSSVVAHVLAYAAHRRQVARELMRAAGASVDDGDPITWVRAALGPTVRPIEESR